MVVMGDIWIEMRCTGTEVDGLQLSHIREVGECLVHGAQGYSWHLGTSRHKQRLGGGMCGIVVQQPKQQLSLRGDLEASIPKRDRELVWTMHA